MLTLEPELEIVTAPDPLCEIPIPVPANSENEPPESDNVFMYDVVPEWLYDCNSFVVDKSPVFEITFPVEMLIPVPAV